MVVDLTEDELEVREEEVDTGCIEGFLKQKGYKKIYGK